mmetsp:Transcript_20584/g.55489  ORF Transcript_20584/g.55489 Transcript_20584/m.55489 type:complete len:342 (-) Transcript_20584:288-1313(-)
MSALRIAMGHLLKNCICHFPRPLWSPSERPCRLCFRALVSSQEELMTTPSWPKARGATANTASELTVAPPAVLSASASGSSDGVAVEPVRAPSATPASREFCSARDRRIASRIMSSSTSSASAWDHPAMDPWSAPASWTERGLATTAGGGGKLRFANDECCVASRSSSCARSQRAAYSSSSACTPRRMGGALGVAAAEKAAPRSCVAMSSAAKGSVARSSGEGSGEIALIVEAEDVDDWDELWRLISGVTLLAPPGDELRDAAAVFMNSWIMRSCVLTRWARCTFSSSTSCCDRGPRKITSRRACLQYGHDGCDSCLSGASWRKHSVQIAFLQQVVRFNRG